jgi:hypothetical protein
MEASAAATLAGHARRSDPPRYHGRTRATTCSRRPKRLPFTQEIAGSTPAGGYAGSSAVPWIAAVLRGPGVPLILAVCREGSGQEGHVLIERVPSIP